MVEGGARPGRWGSEAQATHCREGEAGHDIPLKGKMGDTLRSQTVSTRLQRIAKQAEDYPQMVFTTLAHHIDVDLLREAYRHTRKNSSPGVDGVTAKQYGEHLEENLQGLYDRLKSGRYKAPPVMRAWLEKDNGKRRPIGKPTFEDKIIQRAVVMLLEPIYEQIFHDFSHGFRRGRSQHRALKELRENLIDLRINWIVIADITGLFDNLDHGILRSLIKKRMNDGTLLRLIGKWLNAGVMEGESIHHPEQGTPQGGVISPMLSNIFLHYVLDDWYKREVHHRLKGRSFLIRWADDFIIGFEYKSDAERVMKVVPKRFERYKLTLQPDKTSLVCFSKPFTKKESKERGTFDFLGFTFYWGKGRKGYWTIKKRTARKRLSRFMKRIWQWCKDNLHEPIGEQYKMLCSKLRGHTEKAWRYWLSRRSHKGKVRFEDLRETYPLPVPRIVHSI
jgi:group II intron reverse transcriptase/maturase